MRHNCLFLIRTKKEHCRCYTLNNIMLYWSAAPNDSAVLVYSRNHLKGHLFVRSSLWRALSCMVKTWLDKMSRFVCETFLVSSQHYILLLARYEWEYSRLSRSSPLMDHWTLGLGVPLFKHVNFASWLWATSKFCSSSPGIKVGLAAMY